MPSNGKGMSGAVALGLLVVVLAAGTGNLDLGALLPDVDAPAVGSEGDGGDRDQFVNADTPASERADIGPWLLEHGVTALDSNGGTGCDARGDIRNHSEKLHWKALRFMQIIVDAGFEIRLSCVHDGHSKYVANSNNISLHWVWAGLDIDQVDGQRVQGGGDRVRAFGEWLRERDNDHLPWEVGGPRAVVDHNRLKRDGTGPFFYNSGHEDHFHFGFK